MISIALHRIIIVVGIGVGGTLLVAAAEFLAEAAELCCGVGGVAEVVTALIFIDDSDKELRKSRCPIKFLISLTRNQFMMKSVFTGYVGTYATGKSSFNM